MTLREAAIGQTVKVKRLTAGHAAFSITVGASVVSSYT